MYFDYFLFILPLHNISSSDVNICSQKTHSISSMLSDEPLIFAKMKQMVVPVSDLRSCTCRRLGAKESYLTLVRVADRIL